MTHPRIDRLRKALGNRAQLHSELRALSTAIEAQRQAEIAAAQQQAKNAATGSQERK